MTKARPLRSVPGPVRSLLHLPERDWPEADRLRFVQTFAQPHDIFDDDGGGNHLKPRTRTAIHYGYRRWLGWIAAHNPELLAANPGSRATPDLVRDYVGHLRLTCAERAVATQIRLLRDALRYMYPARDWSWLREIKARLERAIPNTGRRPILLTSQRIVDTSLERLDKIDVEYAHGAATASRRTPQNLAIRYRDALLVAIASFVPMRRSNLADLMIGSSFCRGPSVWSIHIPGDLVKNGEPIDADLPDWISERVDRFIDVYRPLICRSSNHAGLWASAKGRPAIGQALYEAFQKEVAHSLGNHLTLHDARRIAATTWAVHDPVNAAGAKDLLGDRSDRVFAQHYNLASGIEASRAMADIVAVLKKTAGR
jgi:integrase/recombinase XerD